MSFDHGFLFQRYFQAFRTTTALDGAQTFHADDLSLPIQLLEGEELKLRDGSFLLI